jgi:hypothetical protein
LAVSIVVAIVTAEESGHPATGATVTSMVMLLIMMMMVMMLVHPMPAIPTMMTIIVCG